VFNENVSMI